MHTARKRVCTPTVPFVPPPSDTPSSSAYSLSVTPPLPVMTTPLLPPTTFIYQTTTVPLTHISPPPASSPPPTLSGPLPSRKRAHFLIPISSDPHVEAEADTVHTGPRRRVDARPWSFLLAVIHVFCSWSLHEGTPRAA